MSPTEDLPAIFVTDFGYDSAKGRAKGAFERHRFEHHGRDNLANILDEVHCINSFSVLSASWEMKEESQEWDFVPHVIVGVVDPGVGTTRRSIAVLFENGVRYVGPDNGLPTHLLEAFTVHTAVELDPNGRRQTASKKLTFDGRDLYGIRAADLVCRVDICELGKKIEPDTIQRLDVPPGTIQHVDTVSTLPKIRDISIGGKVSLHKVLEGIAAQDQDPIPCNIKFHRNTYRLFAKQGINGSLSSTFGDEKGKCVIYPGSSHSPEFALVQQRTCERLKLQVGDRISIGNEQELLQNNFIQSLCQDR